MLLPVLLMLVSATHAQTPGTLDLTYNTSGKLIQSLGTGPDLGYGVALQDDGKIIVTGLDYESGDLYLVRYNNDGTIDASFGTGGVVNTDFGLMESTSVVRITNDGKILVGGCSSNTINPNMLLVRYLENGSIDASFGIDGKVIIDMGSTESVRDIEIAPDNKIIIIGEYEVPPDVAWLLVRLDADGNYDNTFNGTGYRKILTAFPFAVFGILPSSLALQDDNKIIVSGERFYTRRFNSDGSDDLSFAEDGIFFDPSGGIACWDIALDSYGNILLGGRSGEGFGNFGTIMKLDTNGDKDLSFGVLGKVAADIGPGINRNINTYRRILIQDDDKILAVGDWQYDILKTDISLARYSSSGVIDESFGSSGIVKSSLGSAGLDFCNDAILQADGKILIVGQSFDGVNYNTLSARYNNNGSSLGNIELAANVNDIKIYPNPLNEFSVLEFTLSKPGKVTVSISGIGGKALGQLAENEYRSPGSYIVSLADLCKSYASGIYILKIQCSDMAAAIKVVIP